jgi:hypothetical protein
MELHSLHSVTQIGDTMDEWVAVSLRIPIE